MFGTTDSLTADLPRLTVNLPREVLLVEDEKHARDALAGLLMKRDYQVKKAESGSAAILEVEKEGASVVLMDIDLGAGIDGIETAQEIRQVQPLTSFIFLSAYAHDPIHRQRAEREGLRVGGWLGKPFKLPDLLSLIDKERRTLEVIASLEKVRDMGYDPRDYLRSQKGILPADFIQELWHELQVSEAELPSFEARQEILPLGDHQEVPEMATIAREIEGIYSQIRKLISERAGGSGLTEALRPLREKLQQLQEQEAEAMELHFRKKIVFDPREGGKLLEQAKQMLGKR